MPSRFRQLADKYTTRAHVASAISEEYLIKLLWQGDDPRAIPFDRLPTDYVIKPNHSSGHVLIVRGEADREAIIRQVSDWLASDYYWPAREYQYYGIKPRIVIEEYLKSRMAVSLSTTDFGASEEFQKSSRWTIMPAISTRF